jgi:hypothetical protein
LSVTASQRALISKVKVRGSLTQAGSSPQRTNAKARFPSFRRTIGIGWVGATL